MRFAGPLLRQKTTLSPHALGPPQPVAVLGYDAQTPEILDAAIATGCAPVLLHAPDGTIPVGSRVRPRGQALWRMRLFSRFSCRGHGEGIDVVNANAFRRSVRQSDIPVLLGCIGRTGRNSVGRLLSYAREVLGLTGDVLHPVVLCDRYSNPHKRFAVIGFPGSGNMIVQNICQELLPSSGHPIWARDPLSAKLTSYALSYWGSLREQIAHAFDNDDCPQVVAGPTHMRYGNFYLSMRDHPIEVFVAGLPQRSHVWANPWHSGHEPLTAKTLEHFSEQNFHLLQILRHPLDLVVSNAAKITVASGERVPELLLQNDDWMEGMLQAVEVYYAGIAENQNASGVTLLRYEALMADPVRTIMQLAELLGVECAESGAGAIWSALSNRPLAGAGHKWAPGAGKWRTFIPRRFVDRIRASRLREYAEAVGYRFEATDFEGSRDAIPENVCNDMYLAWEDGRWEVITGKPRALVHSDVCRVHDEESGLLALGARQYELAIDRLVQSSDLRNLMAAGKGDAWEPPLLSAFLKQSIALRRG